MTTSAAAGIFPGQGSQFVGMGQELSERFSVVRETFAEADDILGFGLTELCFSGDADELKRTSNAQPALLTISTAYWRLISGQGFSCSVVAGHSLGEYSALVANGAIEFSDALTLVRRRGQLMEEAAAENPGGMAAVLNLSDDDVQALCAEVSAENGIVVPANFNSPGQVVISGVAEAVAAARAAAKARGGRAIPLAVSGPFHSPLMQSAADNFAEVLNEINISVPAIPIVPNVTAEATTDAAIIRDALARQITSSVQWVKSLHTMRNMGVSRFVEVGPGNVLVGLTQRTLPDVETASVDDLIVD